jgi:Fur family ferric uptake transcriptional regulator
MGELSPMDILKKKLQEKQYKLTTQRQVILNVFVEHQGEHLSAEDVHMILKGEASDIGLATVYRTVELLSQIEILQKIDFGDGCSRFELDFRDSSRHHHHHLICMDCGSVFEFDDDLLEDLENTIQQKSKFKVLDHQVKFYGRCQECQIKRDSK